MLTIKPAVLLCAALLLAGCAGFSQDSGFDPVQQSAERQLDKQLLWARERGSVPNFLQGDKLEPDKSPKKRAPCQLRSLPSFASL